MWLQNIAGVADNLLGQEQQKFEALSEEQKEEVFLSTIEWIKKNKDFQNLEKWWKKQSWKKKMQYYKDWEMISVGGAINYATKAPWTVEISANPFKKPHIRWVPEISLNPFKRTKTKIKEWIETSIYEQVPRVMRLWVSFWLLKKPLFLSEKKLLSNIETDAHTLAKNLWIFKKVCKYVPQLMILYPIISKLLPYAQWYEKKWASLMQERIKNRKKKQTEKSTTYSLSSVETDMVKTEVMANNKNIQDKKTENKGIENKEATIETKNKSGTYNH